MRTFPGVVVGIVKSLRDPEGQGRIQVEFPWMQARHKSTWAPIAVPFAGKRRGSFFMPELDDEALVAFEHGDFDHPFIVGFLWNGVDRPPDDGITASVRRLRTVAGHVLEFDDRDGQERVLLRTAGGQELELLDGPPPKVTLKVKDGQPGQIRIVAELGTVEVKCLRATIDASAQVSVTAPITSFSGIVEAQTVIAKAVVSQAYTPAPGDTYGL
jgi:uncharacterized protein involved in type VI secretion and phage assembly